MEGGAAAGLLVDAVEHSGAEFCAEEAAERCLQLDIDGHAAVLGTVLGGGLRGGFGKVTGGIGGVVFDPLRDLDGRVGCAAPAFEKLVGEIIDAGE